MPTGPLNLNDSVVSQNTLVLKQNPFSMFSVSIGGDVMPLVTRSQAFTLYLTSPNSS